MKTKTIAYYLYLMACFTAMVAIVIDNELLLLFSKPIIIPAIYFYYLTKTKKANLAFTVFMMLSFIGDTIILLKIPDRFLIMAPYYLSYLILTGLIISDLLKLKHQLTNVLLAMVVLAGHALLLYLVLDLQSIDGKKFLLPFTIYGVTLSIMVTLAVYHYLSSKSISGFYVLVGCGCCLVSDVFYIVYNEHLHLPLLSYINSAMQFFSYLFLVKYILNRKARTKTQSGKPNGQAVEITH